MRRMSGAHEGIQGEERGSDRNRRTPNDVNLVFPTSTQLMAEFIRRLLFPFSLPSS